MKYRYCILTVLIVLAADVLAGVIGDYFALREPDAGTEHSAFKQSLFDKEAECLILGASRASSHYDPSIIEDSIGLKTYNAGISGGNIFISYPQLCGFMSRCIPKIVILDLTRGQVDGDWRPRFMTHKVYYGLCDEYTEMFDRYYGVFDRLKLKSNLFRFNNAVPNLVKSYIIGDTDFNGFFPLTGSASGLSPCEDENRSFVLTDERVEVLISIIKICRENSIELIAVSSPHLRTNKAVNRVLDSLFTAHSVPFISYVGREPYISDMSLFKDYSHLNHKGAEIFSKDFAHRLKEMKQDASLALSPDNAYLCGRSDSLE